MFSAYARAFKRPDIEEYVHITREQIKEQKIFYFHVKILNEAGHRVCEDHLEMRTSRMMLREEVICQ